MKIITNFLNITEYVYKLNSFTQEKSLLTGESIL